MIRTCSAILLVLGFLASVSRPLAAQREQEVPSLGSLSTSTIYEQVADSVVRICGVMCGSGVILDVSDNQGTIATNAHVLEGADTAQVMLSDGTVHQVQGALAIDAAVDIMLITIEAPDLQAVRLGNFEALAIGQEIVAVGSPAGLLNTVSESIISGCRTLSSVNSRSQFATDRLQIDGGTAPGSSGGGVFNRAGELIGLAVEGGATTDTADIDFIVPLPFIQWLYENRSVQPISIAQARRLQDLYSTGLRIVETFDATGDAASSLADAAEQARNAVELYFRDPRFDSVLTTQVKLLRGVAEISSNAQELQREALLDWVPQPLQPGSLCANFAAKSSQEP